MNGYVPSLQSGGGVVYFMKQHLGARVPSTTLVAPLSARFVQAIERFVDTKGLDLVTFAKGQRKDDVAQAVPRVVHGDEGVLFVGKAQEKASVFRTEKRRNADDGSTYPVDLPLDHAGQSLLLLPSRPRLRPAVHQVLLATFPTPMKVCLNGHEWLKRQLTQRGIPYEPLDNGIRIQRRRGARPTPRQHPRCARRSTPSCRKWLRRLPHPFTAAHRAAGYRYQLSILQAEFALTQVLDRPATGRGFFEEVMRENLDLGRPDQMQLVFPRRRAISRRTPGPFRTRILTEGVLPSLHVDYKKSRVKQYHKEGQALRTETTINNTYDFEIGRALRNLPALREIGFAANRRLLRVEYLSHDCLIGDDHLEALTQPVVIDTQHAAALHLGDRRVLALMQTLCLFALSPTGFRHRDIRGPVAQLLGRTPDQYASGQMTYDLRRLRFHQLIDRVPDTHRYRLTERGARLAVLYVRIYARGFRPPASLPTVGTHRGSPVMERLDAALTKFLQEVRLVA